MKRNRSHKEFYGKGVWGVPIAKLRKKVESGICGTWNNLEPTLQPPAAVGGLQLHDQEWLCAFVTYHGPHLQLRNSLYTGLFFKLSSLYPFSSDCSLPALQFLCASSTWRGKQCRVRSFMLQSLLYCLFLLANPCPHGMASLSIGRMNLWFSLDQVRSERKYSARHLAEKVTEGGGGIECGASDEIWVSKRYLLKLGNSIVRTYKLSAPEQFSTSGFHTR